MQKKLLLIGWDAADWKTIDRLVDQGDMLMLKGPIERANSGTRGNLTTLHPVLSPMPWSRIAAGKRLSTSAAAARAERPCNTRRRVSV